MTRACVIGVDPGQTTGIARLLLADLSVELVQCSAGVVLDVVAALAGDRPAQLAVEQFVVGPRASRSASPQAAQITRDLIGALLAADGARVKLRTAAGVKPWATDARLKAAGLHRPGMRHAMDAARHALFAAVSDCGIPDPLSKRSTPPCSPTGA